MQPYVLLYNYYDNSLRVCRLQGLEHCTRSADRSEPQYGLEPRFEALPKFGKSPNSPGGVMAKAITPHPQRVQCSNPFRLIYIYIYAIYRTI